MTKFNIGDRVRVRDYYDLPEEDRTPSTGRLCGKDGEVVDIVFGNAKKKFYYTLAIDGYGKPSAKLFTDDCLVAIKSNVTYRHDIAYLENVVCVRLMEVADDGTETEIAKGHGHIMHDGALGIAQATSYAMKRIYFDVRGQNDGD